MFQDFFGNSEAAETLEQAIRANRIPQTILLAGPEGVGKATLARRVAARLLGKADQIEQDDLSLEANAALISDRENWTSEKRADDPLLFASHPDFITFPPEGPLRQISIPQMRLLKERAQYKPLHGNHRVFLIDHIDRANEQAANSLLKTLEEPPDHLVVFLTAENAYDLLPTIRSRSVILQLALLSPEEMGKFIASRKLDQAARRAALAGGSPGVAVRLDLDEYGKRRAAMLTLLETGCGVAPFASWVKFSESIGAGKSEKLDAYLKVLYVLLDDILRLQHGRPDIRNTDVLPQLSRIAERAPFQWMDRALRIADEIGGLIRRNIQKSLALDAMVLSLREAA